VSSNDKFSVTGYVRNIGDNVYKTSNSGVTGGTGSPLSMQVTPSDPRTYGVVANVRF
jgi:outer membrane receptor protein involved in Fe transport